MGDVVSFEAHKNGETLVMNEPCQRPFHDERYIRTIRNTQTCMRCNIPVARTAHPSFDGERWYG